MTDFSSKRRLLDAACEIARRAGHAILEVYGRAELVVERLKQLRVEHRDLDQVISRLVTDPNVDQLMLKRLKKRKLMLKDMITQLESARIPDLNA